MHASPTEPAGRVENACLWLTGACLVALVAVIMVEVVTRSLFHYSFELVDEVGGYLTVAVTFLALAPAQARKAFHSVELVQRRLSARAQRRWQAGFLGFSLAFALVTLGMSVRFVWRSWQQGEVASTAWQTPLWIPQCVMLLGMAALCFTLGKEFLLACKRINAVEASHDA